MMRAKAMKYCRAMLLAAICASPGLVVGQLGFVLDEPTRIPDIPGILRQAVSLRDVEPNSGPPNGDQSAAAFFSGSGANVITFVGDPGPVVVPATILNNATLAAQTGTLTLVAPGVTPNPSTWLSGVVRQGGNNSFWNTSGPIDVSLVNNGSLALSFAVDEAAFLNPDTGAVPGIYRVSVVYTVDGAVAATYEIEFFVSSSIIYYEYPLGSLTNGPNASLFMRAVSSNPSDLEVLLRYETLSASRVVPLYTGGGLGAAGFREAASPFQDITLLIADRGVEPAEVAYDRAVPSVTGVWKGTSALTDSSFLLPNLDPEPPIYTFAARPSLPFLSSSLIFYSKTDDYDVTLPIEAIYYGGPRLDGDLDPRGERAGGILVYNLLNVTDQIVGSFLLMDYYQEDGRLLPTRTSAEIRPDGSSNSAATIAAIDRENVDPNLNNLAGLLPSVPSPLARGFDPIGTAPVVSFSNSLKDSDGLEFARIDVGPGRTLGDGLITVSDFVAVGRYIAGNGFDAAQPLGGPISAGDRSVRLGTAGQRFSLRRGTPDAQLPEIPIVLRTKGVEQTVALAIQYDPAVLEFVSSRRNGRTTNFPTFEVINQVSAGSGVVGIEIGLVPNQTFPLTTQESSTGERSGTNFNRFVPVFPLVGSGSTTYETGSGVNKDVVIGFVKFRPKAGTSGAINTELAMQEGGTLPLSGREPSVRTPSGNELYAQFLPTSVTVLDSAQAVSTVRLQESFLLAGDGSGALPPEGEIQSIPIVLDSTGIENAIGFSLQFNPADMDLIGIRPAATFPGAGFVLSNPDFDYTATGSVVTALREDFRFRTDEAGLVNVLIALPAGQTFAAGTTPIAILDLKPRALAPDARSASLPVRFLPLGDQLEVSDANAFPIASSFGQDAGGNDEIRIISGTACDYAFSTTPTAVGGQINYDLLGGAGSVQISTTSDCDWSVAVDYGTSTPGWLSLEGTTGTVVTGSGNGIVRFNVASHDGTTRTASLVFAGQRLTIRQEGCTVSASIPSSEGGVSFFTGLGGVASVSISVPRAECEWTASSNASWINFGTSNGNPLGSVTSEGNRSLQFFVEPNTGEPRSGIITVGEQSFTIEQDFTFTAGAQSWTNAPSAFPFSTPNFSVGGGALNMQFTNNTNNFGVWTSPEFAITAAGNDLYRTNFRVRTSETDASRVPTFRMRASSGDMSQTAALSVASSQIAPADNDYVPEANDTGRLYEHYFTLPGTGATSFRLFFDGLNFMADDAPNASIGLTTLAIAKLSKANLAGVRPEFATPLVVRNAFDQFEKISIVPFGLTASENTGAIFQNDIKGLLIGSAVSDPNQARTVVGLTQLNPALVGRPVVLAAPRLYEIRYTVSAKQAASTQIRREKVPAFRLRAGESSLQASWTLNLESISDTSIMPTFLTPQTYSLWFGTTGELAGNNLSIAFDYIYTPASNNDPGISLVLEEINVISYTRPQ